MATSIFSSRSKISTRSTFYTALVFAVFGLGTTATQAQSTVAAPAKTAAAANAYSQPKPVAGNPTIKIPASQAGQNQVGKPGFNLVPPQNSTPSYTPSPYPMVSKPEGGSSNGGFAKPAAPLIIPEEAAKLQKPVVPPKGLVDKLEMPKQTQAEQQKMLAGMKKCMDDNKQDASAQRTCLMNSGFVKPLPPELANVKPPENAELKASLEKMTTPPATATKKPKAEGVKK